MNKILEGGGEASFKIAEYTTMAKLTTYMNQLSITRFEDKWKAFFLPTINNDVNLD